MPDPVEYDRAPTMFSPDGRLLQVEYAKKTVKQGSSVIGIVTKNEALIIADKRLIDPLVVKELIEKVYNVDDHIIASSAGIISDARVLIDYARSKAQQHKLSFGMPIDTLALVKEIADVQQVYTQVGGHRPFGVSLIIAGYDQKPSIYVTDPVGIYFPYYAVAIGSNDEKIMEILHKEYKKNMELKDALKLGIKALKDSINDLSAERLEARYVDKEGIHIISEEELKKFF